MTTPDERTRNLLQAGAFLMELEADTSLPERVRREAHRLLRHYPTVSDVALLAAADKKVIGSVLLTTKIEPGWFMGYQFGPQPK